jgi:hypothetical protein
MVPCVSLGFEPYHKILGESHFSFGGLCGVLSSGIGPGVRLGTVEGV